MEWNTEMPLPFPEHLTVVHLPACTNTARNIIRIRDFAKGNELNPLIYLYHKYSNFLLWTVYKLL